MNWCYLGSSGASREILSMWDKRVVEIVKEYMGLFIVACSFRNIPNNFELAKPKW